MVKWLRFSDILVGKLDLKKKEKRKEKALLHRYANFCAVNFSNNFIYSNFSHWLEKFLNMEQLAFAGEPVSSSVPLHSEKLSGSLCLGLCH